MSSRRAAVAAVRVGILAKQFPELEDSRPGILAGKRAGKNFYIRCSHDYLVCFTGIKMFCRRTIRGG